MAGTSRTAKAGSEAVRRARAGGESHHPEERLEGAAHEQPGPAGVREHQEVYAACGTLVGTVDRIEGAHIKIDDPSGCPRLIPIAWVAKVDDRHIDLNRDLRDVQGLWQSP